MNKYVKLYGRNAGLVYEAAKLTAQDVKRCPVAPPTWCGIGGLQYLQTSCGDIAVEPGMMVAITHQAIKRGSTPEKPEQETVSSVWYSAAFEQEFKPQGQQPRE